MSLFRFTVPMIALSFLIAGAASADDVSAKQKKVAVDNLIKAEIAKGAAAEGEAVIVAGRLPEARLKTIAASLSKTNKLARKALQFDDKDEAWKGKLTIYYLPERKEFAQFMRLVVGSRQEGNYYIAVRGDEPYVVGGVDLDAKAADGDISAELGPLVAGAMMQAKVGTAAAIPPWVRLGLGRAVALRADGVTGKRYSAFKSQARAAVLGGAGKPGAPIADIWTSDRADGTLLATSLMDYFAFGPGKANFGKFLSALRPDETGKEPDIAKVIEDAGWKRPIDLEAAWKKWVVAGSPAK
jgi:hypothetical protein